LRLRLQPPYEEITDIMAIGVIDGFEMVAIEKNRRDSNRLLRWVDPIV
jgi:hypothetical protein